MKENRKNMNGSLKHEPVSLLSFRLINGELKFLAMDALFRAAIRVLSIARRQTEGWWVWISREATEPLSPFDLYVQGLDGFRGWRILIYFFRPSATTFASWYIAPVF